MSEALLQGIFFGLVLTIFVGPVFFMLIKTSVSQGIKAALILDAGIVFSDICCIALSYFGMAQLLQEPKYKIIFGVVGGILLMAYGAHSIFAKPKVETIVGAKGITGAHGIKLFVKGFIFNTSVPSVIFFWIATVTLAITEFNNETSKVVVYLSTVVLTYFAFDVLKIYLASKAKKFFSGERQHIIRKVAGIALIIFGGVIIYKVIAGK